MGELSSRLGASSGGSDEIVLQGGEYAAKVEINDAANRATLTKGPVQAEIHRDTGAVVSTKGVWYPDRSTAPPGGEPPLFLEVTAKTREEVERGVEAVRAVIARDQERHAVERPPFHQGFRPRGPRCEAKVSIELESHHRWFNVRSKVVGPGGIFVKYIQEESGARVQIKGWGSGYIEHSTGREAEEPMYIHILGPDQERVQEAKELAEDLLEVVREEYAKTKAFYEGNGGGGGSHMGGFHGGYGPRSQFGGGGAARNSPSHALSADAAPPSGSLGDRHPSANATPALVHQVSAAAEPQEQPQAKSAEQETLDKYWHDYKAWEKSFVDYHKREPRPDEGKQEVPPEYL